MKVKIKPEDKTYLLSLKREDMDDKLIISLFADTAKVDKTTRKVTVKPSRFEPYAEFDLDAGEYINATKITTTVGSFIYNKYIVEEALAPILGYVNDTLNGGNLDKLEKKLSDALLVDKITELDFKNYLDRTQWMSMQFHAIFCGSFTMNTLNPSPNVIKERDRRLKESKEEVERGDIVAVVKLEKDLLDMANKELGNDHGLDLYKSGARGSFNNNFKNISVMKGPVYNPSTGRFDIVQSNFMEGIRKEELAIYGNSVVTGAYPKAIGTAKSGYFSKQIIAALQAVVLDKAGSDCKSIGYANITITDKNADDFRYRYILEGGKLVLLDDNVIPKYINKRVKMRSALYCTGKKLCRACAGLMYEKLGIENVGMTSSRVSSTLLNLSMKKFHDSTAKLSKVEKSSIVL